MLIREDQPYSPIAPTESFPSVFSCCSIKDGVWCSDKPERGLPRRVFAPFMPAHIWEEKHQLCSNTKGSFHHGTEDSEPLITLTFSNFHSSSFSHTHLPGLLHSHNTRDKATKNTGFFSSYMIKKKKLQKPEKYNLTTKKHSEEIQLICHCCYI